LVLLASRLDELQAAVGTADVVLTRSMAEACDTVRAMQPAPSEAVAPAVAAFAAAAAASAAAAAAATAAADGHETDVDDAMEPGEEADDAAADASGGAARPATAAAAAAAAAALTPAATSHNGAGGSGGVGGQLPPMSENALHKHREGVTMVFDELTSRQVCFKSYPQCFIVGFIGLSLMDCFFFFSMDGAWNWFLCLFLSILFVGGSVGVFGQLVPPHTLAGDRPTVAVVLQAQRDLPRGHREVHAAEPRGHARVHVRCTTSI